MRDEPLCTAELEQRRLVFLNMLVNEPTKWRPGSGDGYCMFCGFRPKPENVALCDDCEDRRQFLAKRYPEILIEKMRHVGAMSREWSPHNSE